MRFLVDEMLARLGRWLRAAGYDTAIVSGGLDDDRVVAWAVAEERLVLTCDKALAARLGARALRLPSSRARDAVPVLERALGVDWRFSPWSRCLACNVALVDVAPDGVAEDHAHVPADRPLYTCPGCAKVFWEGAHVARLDARLRDLATTTRR